MNLKQFYIGRSIGFFVLILLVGVWFLWSRLYQNDPGSPSTVETSEVVNLDTTNKNELLPETNNYDPISLPALAVKEFNGRDLTLGQILSDNSVYTRYYITYKSGDLTISGIMNIPKGFGPFPVLLLNHGYIDPAIYTNGRGLKREQDYLARQGYAVLHSDYRNHAQSDTDPDNDVHFRLGYVEDVINAALAVQKSNLPQLDTNNIGMLGHSMGGGVTMNILVTKPDLIKAAVLFAPVSTDNYDNFKRWTVSRPETVEKIVSTYNTPEQNPEFWNNISAINFLDTIKTPILLHHGTADESVPVEWSEKLANLLKAKNKAIDYREYSGQPHEFTSVWPEVMKSSTEFFNTYLK